MVTNKYAERLHDDFPNLEIKKIQLIGQGWHHDALEVNDSLIFRIPRAIHEQSDSVGYETAVLEYFQGLVPVEIPNPTFIAPEQSYFGYPKLNGQPLITFYADFDEHDKFNLREDWIHIASAIHQSLSVDQARKLGVPEFEVSLVDAREILHLHGIDKVVLDFANQTIETISDIDLGSQHMSFIHNDIQFHNVLINPATKKITGLIDWTDVCVAPIAREFSAWEWLHDEQIKQVIELYEERTGTKIDVVQAKTWRYLEEISDFVEHTKTNNVEAAKQSLDHIRQWIAESKKR